jgi:hypothetical protein
MNYRAEGLLTGDQYHPLSDQLVFLNERFPDNR